MVLVHLAVWQFFGNFVVSVSQERLSAFQIAQFTKEAQNRKANIRVRLCDWRKKKHGCMWRRHTAPLLNHYDTAPTVPPSHSDTVKFTNSGQHTRQVQDITPEYSRQTGHNLFHATKSHGAMEDVVLDKGNWETDGSNYMEKGEGRRCMDVSGGKSSWSRGKVVSLIL